MDDLISVRDLPLGIFRDVPRVSKSHGDLLSSLQSLETSLLLVSLGRLPHALTTCGSAIEGAIRAANLLGEKDTLGPALVKAEKSCASLSAISESDRKQFLGARNRIMHHGFSPRDDGECAALIVTTGIPILGACYKDLHSFDLFDSFLLEYRGLLDVADAVIKLCESKPEVDVAYAVNPFGHRLRWALQPMFSPTWAMQLLDESEESFLNYEDIKRVSIAIERAFGGTTWEVRCPICGSEAICELDEGTLSMGEILAKQMACPSCDFVIQEDHLFLCGLLLGEQLEAAQSEIRNEFGLK